MRERSDGHTILLEFTDNSPVLEPIPFDPKPSDLDRWERRQLLALEQGDASERALARRSLTSICALRIKALLARTACDAGCAAVAETIDRLEKLRGHIAERAELEALVASLARSVGSDLDVSGATDTPLNARYPELMASEFAPLIDRIRELADLPE